MAITDILFCQTFIDNNAGLKATGMVAGENNDKAFGVLIIYKRKPSCRQYFQFKVRCIAAYIG
jgi:hypothetical protein